MNRVKWTIKPKQDCRLHERDRQTDKNRQTKTGRQRQTDIQKQIQTGTETDTQGQPQSMRVRESIGRRK